MTLMELKKIYNDKRELLILLFGAILICTLTGLVAHRKPQEINVTIFVDRLLQSSPFDNKETRQVIAAIDESAVFSVSNAYSLRDAMQDLIEGNSRAIIALRTGVTGVEAVQVTVDATDIIIQQAITNELRPILEASSKQATIELLPTVGLSPQQASRFISPISVDMKTNEWQEIKYFDLFASPLIIMIILGICLLITVTTVTSERSQGTMERIFASPYRKSEIILSRMLARSVLAITVSILIVLTLKLMFNVALGDLILALIITTLVGINGVIFGLLVSSITYSELESVAYGITSWLVFMIMMGFMWPLETMHPIFESIAHLTPYLYGVHAIRHVSLVGWGLRQVWLDVAILCGFIMVQALVTIQILRREIR